MKHDEWLASVPAEITGDPLWRMEVYRLALFVSDIAWPDTCKLMQNHSTLGLSDQLYRATGSISANFAEGYSRRSGKDQAGSMNMRWVRRVNHAPGIIKAGTF
jgi:hypothetical protein